MKMGRKEEKFITKDEAKKFQIFSWAVGIDHLPGTMKKHFLFSFSSPNP